MAQKFLTIKSHMVSADIVSGLGGGLIRYSARVGKDEYHLLKPTNQADLNAGKAYRLSSFPLVPYSNRIAGGRFKFAGRDVVLSDGARPEMEVIHGHGWKARWTVRDHAENWASLSYRHDAAAWPFTYGVTQNFALTGNALSITLTVTNLDDAAMPIGLGFHPCFPSQRTALLTAPVEQVWLNDERVLPTRKIDLPPAWDLVRGVPVREMRSDNVFTAWRRIARIHWRDRGIGLNLRAGGPLEFLHVYAPEGKDFFCVEPVSHIANALNLSEQGHGDTGQRVLAPGESLEAWMRLEPFSPHF